MLYRMRLLFVVLLVSFLHPALFHAQQAEWSSYKNKRWGFEIEYPAGWQHDEGVNHAGIATWPTRSNTSGEITSIVVGGRVNQPAWGVNERRIQTLDEMFTGKPEILSKISTPVIASKEIRMFVGVPAIYAKITYKVGRQKWTCRTVDLIAPDGVVYHLEMRSRNNEFSSIDAKFEHVLKSFRLPR